MSEVPPEIENAREFCRSAGIEVAAWGQDTLLVKAESPDRAEQIATQLRQLGFESVEDEDDLKAGLLLVSRNPSTIRAKQASFDISRRRWDELMVPLVWGAGSFIFFRYSTIERPPVSWLNAALGASLLALFLWEGSRIWGWKIEILPGELRVRRRYRWTSIPWNQICAVETVPSRARDQEAIIVRLSSNDLESLGAFNFAFARNARDRLRVELAKKRGEVK